MWPFDQERLEQEWEILQQNRETMETILESETVEYDLGSPSKHATAGGWFDRNIPEEVLELEDEGLVKKRLEHYGDGSVAVYEATSIGEGLFEKESLEEAQKWYRELEKYAKDEYGW